MQHADPVAIGSCGDEQVDGRHAVMPDACELGLCIEGTLRYDIVEVVQGERQQLGEELIMPASVAGRVAATR